jgi:hypothetical protein
MIHTLVRSKQIGRILACLTLPACFSAGLLAQDDGGAKAPASSSTRRVTHILGFEGTSNNANGELSIQGDALRFEKSAGSGAQITIGSILDVSLGEQDKQVGGAPMAVGRAAAPFGGGRVIGLFAHKKYDTVTIQYLDSNGGFHGAIFQLNKGQGEVLKNELVSAGAHVDNPEDPATKKGTEETKNEVK